MFQIHAQRPHEAPAVEALLDKAFGPNRKLKTSYRYRDHADPVSGLSFAAWQGPRLIGTIRFWAVALGAEPALLLGPLAVDPEFQGEGIGAALIHKGLVAAASAGHGTVVLVGDEPYYARFGFRPAARMGLVMPGENPARVLARPPVAPAPQWAPRAQSMQINVAGSSSIRPAAIADPHAVQ